MTIRRSEPEIVSVEERSRQRAITRRTIGPTDITQTGGQMNWYVDHIYEYTLDHGVTVDGVHNIDGQIGLGTELPATDIEAYRDTPEFRMTDTTNDYYTSVFRHDLGAERYSNVLSPTASSKAFDCRDNPAQNRFMNTTLSVRDDIGVWESLSVMFWVKIEEGQAGEIVGAFDNEPAGTGKALIIGNGVNGWRIAFGGGFPGFWEPGFYPTYGEWECICIVVAVVFEEIYFFRNGVFLAEHDISYLAADQKGWPERTLWVGNANYGIGTGTHFGGIIDEMRIYTGVFATPIDQTWPRRHYQWRTHVDPLGSPTPLAGYHFEDDTTDWTGGYDGAGTNMLYTTGALPNITGADEVDIPIWQCVDGVEIGEYGHVIFSDQTARTTLAGQTIRFFAAGKEQGLFDASGNLSLDTNVFIIDQQELRFYDNGNYVGFEAPDLGANQIWKLPTADGNADDIIKTSGAGAGALSFASVTSLETDPVFSATELSNVTDTEALELQNIGDTTISAAQWVYLGDMDQGVATTDLVEFAGLTMTGDIDMGDNDITNLREITAFDGGLNIDFDAVSPGTVYITSTAGVFDSYTKLMLHFNGVDGATTTTDSSQSAHTITFVGDAQLDTAQKKWGTASLLLDGTGDYLTVADHVDWDFGVDVWTIDMQVRFDDNTKDGVLISHYKDDNNRWMFYYNGGDFLQWVYVEGGVNHGFNGDAWVPTNGVWYHIALIFDGIDVIIAVDGVDKGSAAFARDITGHTGLLGIGARYFGAAWSLPFDGQFDELRVSKGIVRFTPPFAPPAAEYTGSAGEANLDIQTTLYVDEIGEHTADAGVTIDGVKCIDSVAQAADFAKTDWPITPGVTLSFDNGTRTFTVTDGGSAYYYIDGVKYTLGGNKTVVINDTEGLWYIYFSGATLTASQVQWSWSAENFAPVAYVYWDATNNKEIFLGYELHTFHTSGTTHARLHWAGGARWESGLLVSDAGGDQINVSAGDIWDEDLNIPITDGAGASLFEQVLSPAELPIYYRSGASDWRIYETADKAAAADAGYVDGANDLHYNKLNGVWASTAAGVGKYVAYYVVATNEQTEPVALIMGQRIDNTLADAKDNNIFSGLSLSGLPFEEMVVLARLILKQTAAGNFYDLEDIQDLRVFNATGSVTSPLITDHGGLGGLADDDHAQYWITGTVRTGDFTTTGTVQADNVNLATINYNYLQNITVFENTEVGDASFGHAFTVYRHPATEGDSWLTIRGRPDKIFSLSATDGMELTSTTGHVDVLPGAGGDIRLFTNAAIGENRFLYQYGYITAAGSKKYIRWTVSDFYDQLVLTREDANVLGFLIAMPLQITDGSGISLQEDISFTGATTENQIKMPDNLADALSVQEGANKYITFDTRNAAEVINFLKNCSFSGTGHDSFTDFVADEHVAHSGVTLTAGTGLDGGGDISANRTFNVDVDGLAEIGAALVDADTFIVDDGDSGTTKKSLMSRVETYCGDQVSTPIYWNALTAEPDATGQGTWVRFVQVTQLHNGTFYNSTTADGDNVTYNFRCPAGTYTLTFNARKGSSFGIVDVYVDASEEGSFDLYAAANDFLNIETIAGLSLSAGAHTIKFQLDGKNGSSADYILNLTGISFQRTA